MSKFEKARSVLERLSPLDKESFYVITTNETRQEALAELDAIESENAKLDALEDANIKLARKVCEARGRIKELEAENERLKSILSVWIAYVDADETIQPPIAETRKILKGGE